MPLQGRQLLGSQRILGSGRSIAALLWQVLAAAEPQRSCEIPGEALQQCQFCGRAHNLPSIACTHMTVRSKTRHPVLSYREASSPIHLLAAGSCMIL